MAFITREVKMNTLGDFLKQARQSQGWNLKEIETKTGISLRYLEFLEKNDFYKFPNLTYARGSLSQYAEFLGLDSSKIIKRFQEEFKEIYTSNKVSSSTLTPRKIFNPKFVLGLIITLLILFYLGFSIKRLLSIPQIEIISPPEDFQTQESTLMIEGRAELGIDVFINDQAVSQINNGYFKEKIELLPGLNIIEISAKKKYSRQRVIYRRVVLEE